MILNKGPEGKRPHGPQLENWGKSGERGHQEGSTQRSEAPSAVLLMERRRPRRSGLSPQNDFGSWRPQGQQRVPLALTVCEQSFKPCPGGLYVLHLVDVIFFQVNHSSYTLDFQSGVTGF